MYTARLLDHFQNPRNVGRLPPPAISIKAENPACGDEMRLSARFEGGRVAEVRYQVRGCTASIAAGSALTTWMEGRTPEELMSVAPAVIEQELGGLEPASKHAAVLCTDALKLLLRAAAQVGHHQGQSAAPDDV